MATGRKPTKKSARKPARKAASATAAPKRLGPELFPGEALTIAKSPDTKAATDEELNQKYVRGEVRIVTESARYPLDAIPAMLEARGGGGPKYLLDPEYQRRHRWSKGRKSRFIESFLMNVPVPPVFLYERDLARYEVMDGRQRLTAIREFYENKLMLEGLEYWPELHGRTYGTLPDKVRDGIDRRYISSVILLKETASSEDEAAKLKKMVFERLNSGGVMLQPQETRNAVYDGPLNQLCLELSGSERFRAMWRIPANPFVEDDDNIETTDRLADPTTAGKIMFEQMDDVELVLRFFAYRQLDSHGSGLNKINDFLDLFLIHGNSFNKRLLKSYRNMFQQTIDLLWDSLGSNAFCKIDENGEPLSRAKPAKIVYDPLMYVASQHLPDRTQLVRAKSELVAQLAELYRDPTDPFNGRFTNSSDVRRRNELVGAAFQSVLGRKRRA